MWAVFLSIGLHLLAVMLLPNIKWEPLKKPDVLQVEILPPPPPKPPEPKPEVLPEPKSEPTPPPPPQPKPRPKPKMVEPKPQPKPAPSPEPVTEPPPPSPEPAPPAVITAPPKAEIPTFTAPPPPPPEPPKPVGPTQADLDAARNQYRGLLEREIVKHKQYPRVAQMRGWQGEAIVELQIDENGKLASVKIQTSSGHDVLDKAALEMVRKTVAAAAPPKILLGASSTYIIPVAFRLQD